MKRMSQSNKNTLTQKSKDTIGQTIVQSLNKSAAQSIEPMSLAEIAAQERQLSLFDDAPIPSVEISTVSAKTRTAKLKSLAPVTRPLRICIAGYRSAPFGGGQGIYIKYLSKALVDAGHQVDVISGQPYPEVDPRVNLIKLPGLDLFNNGLRSLRAHHLTSLTNIIEWTGKLTGGFSEPYCFSRRLYKYLKSRRADYDIIHDNQCLGWGMLKLQKKGFNLLTTIHHPITSDLAIALNASDDKWQRFFIRRWYSFLSMQKRVASQLDHVVTVSKQSTADISKDFSIDADNIHLVYNGIDTEVFKPMRGVKRDPWQIMAIASADQPLKGLRYLLLALSQLVQRYPQLSLLLVSKPQEEGETEQLIRRLNLAKHIQFVHGVSAEALVKHYAESSIAVVPSIYEGFGLPAGEAMACAVPLIATNGGALPEVVGDAGVTVAIKDPTAMASAIEDLLLDADARKRYGKQGRKHIEKNFSWTLAAKEMTALYYQVIDADKANGKILSNQAANEQLFQRSDLPAEEVNHANH